MADVIKLYPEQKRDADLERAFVFVFQGEDLLEVSLDGKVARSISRSGEWVEWPPQLIADLRAILNGDMPVPPEFLNFTGDDPPDAG